MSAPMWPALTAMALGAAGASAANERFAVLPVDAGDGGANAVRAAAAVRAALLHSDLTVLALEPTRAVLVDYQHRGGAELLSYQARLEQAEAALSALDEASSLQILELLIMDLAADPEFSRDKQSLLQLARVKLAARLIGLAGAKETGKGETDNGRRARVLLADALRANPKLAPSRDDFPPRFHLLLDLARRELTERGTGGMQVDSRPRDATVFIEGREVGKTPLTLGNDMLTKGSYRVWVEHLGARSVPQVLEVGERVTPMFVDLDFEGALWADGPGLRPLAGTTIDQQVAQKIGRFLEVDTLLLVGTARYDDDALWLWGAAFSVADGTTARRGAVRVAEAGASETTLHNALGAASTTLASFLGRGDHRGVEDRDLPASVLPQHTREGLVGPTGAPVTSQTTAGEGVPWVAVGGAGAVAGVLVAALVTAGIVTLLASQPANAQLVISAERLK